MIIRNYSAPNIRVISEIRGEIHHTNRTNHTNYTQLNSWSIHTPVRNKKYFIIFQCCILQPLC